METLNLSCHEVVATRARVMPSNLVYLLFVLCYAGKNISASSWYQIWRQRILSPKEPRY